MPPPPPEGPPVRSTDEEPIRRFVEHWGLMARLWGINPTMGELFALLYLSGADWSADELRDRLRISRGNVSMNLRELIAWGVVEKVHHEGQRREYYRAEGNVWTLFRRIIRERKRREIDPTLMLLGQAVGDLGRADGSDVVRRRAEDLRHFFRIVDHLAERLVRLAPEELEALLRLLGPPSPGTPERMAASVRRLKSPRRFLDGGPFPLEPGMTTHSGGINTRSLSSRADVPGRAAHASWAEGVGISPWG